jgi:hypothetical protein
VEDNLIRVEISMYSRRDRLNDSNVQTETSIVRNVRNDPKDAPHIHLKKKKKTSVDP